MKDTPFQKLLADLKDSFRYTTERLSGGTGIGFYRMGQIRSGEVRPTFDEFTHIVTYIGGIARRIRYDDLFPIEVSTASKRNTMIADDREAGSIRNFRTRANVSQTQVSLFLDPTERTQFPAWMIPLSKVKHELLGYLANEAGGHYTAPVHLLSKDMQEIICKILHSCGSIIKHRDDKVREKAEIEKIFKCAEAALKAIK